METTIMGLGFSREMVIIAIMVIMCSNNCNTNCNTIVVVNAIF